MKIFRVLKIVFSVILGVLIVALVGINVYVMVMNMQGKAVSFGDYYVMQVTTGSMEPSIHTDDYILVKKTDADTLEEGDIISFYSHDDKIYGNINTHRIVEITDEGFITRGDANTTEDDTIVEKDDVIGIYTGKVRFLRWLASFGTKRKLILLAVIIPTLAIAFYELRTIAQIRRESSEEKLSEEREERIRAAIDEEKKKLYEKAAEEEKVKANESREDNEKEDVHSDST